MSAEASPGRAQRPVARRRAGSAFDLLVVGDANPDVVLSGVPSELAYAQVEQLVDTGLLTIGGSAAIMACAAARLGLRTAFVGMVGDDAAGRFMLSELTARGVDVSGCVTHESLATGLTVNLVKEEDRAILTFVGCISALAARQVSRELLRSSRHLHVSSFFLQPLLAAESTGLFEEAQAAGLTTSLDTNWDPADEWDGGLAGALPHTDLLFPNSEEALAIANVLVKPGAPPERGLESAVGTAVGTQASHDLESTGAMPVARGLEWAVGTLARHGPLPVVKSGADGAVTHVDGRLVRAPGVTAGVIDTVGAGDSFDAGFLAGWLNDYGIERSLALAVACGALSTRGAGGVAMQATLDEALAIAGAARPGSA